MDEFLYRGVNEEFHRKLGGRLVPKKNAAFIKGCNWDEFQWDNFYWDENKENAVIDHQLHQAGNPTSGISTTPKIDRAKFYATSGGAHKRGVIYKISPKLCIEYGVAMYKVSKIVPNPSIPEDCEVVLVAKDFGELPIPVVVEVITFNA